MNTLRLTALIFCLLLGRDAWAQVTLPTAPTTVGPIADRPSLRPDFVRSGFDAVLQARSLVASAARQRSLAQGSARGMRNYGLLTLGFGAVAAAIMGQGASDDQVTIAGAFGAGALLTSIAFVFDAGDYAEARRTERYYIREADRRVEALREGARRPR